MGDVNFYIKQLEAENEKLRASLESALLTNEIESKRNIFMYEKWITEVDGTIHQSESTLDKSELRRWIDYKHTDLIGYDNFILSFICTAYKKDKNVAVARIVWDMEYELDKSKAKPGGLAICKLVRGRAYRTGDDYRKLNETSIRTKKYGE